VARETVVDALRVRVEPTSRALGAAAALDAAVALREAIDAHGFAHAMFATGNSQFDFLDALVRDDTVDWSRVVGFHMDEYVGITADHPASFRRYLRERLVERVPIPAFHFIEGDASDASAECDRYAALLREHPLDLCCLGIGENGHLAFNDPPVADFDDPLDVKVVELDDACRRQQVGEGHFPDIDAVPTRAITVTIPALLRASTVLAIVPEARKAEPVRRALEGPIDTTCPASILRTRTNATLYLDAESSARYFFDGTDGRLPVR
jgi:glucosamine-6-phosphate deaminase